MKTNKGLEISLIELDSSQKNLNQVESTTTLEEKNENSPAQEQNITLFPLFKDPKLAKASFSCSLYLEFFQIAIKALVCLLVFVAVAFCIFKALYGQDLPSLMAHPLDQNKKGNDWFNKTFQAVALYLMLTLIFSLAMTFFCWKSLGSLVDKIASTTILWTENLYSLLIEGFPEEVTKEELKEFFHSVMASKNINGSIKSIVFLQDYREYQQEISRCKQLKKKLVDSRVDEEYKKQVEKLKKMELEFDQQKRFKGKVVVIFETMETKQAFQKLFQFGGMIKMLRKILSFLLKKSNRKTLTVSELFEPQNVAYENLHYSDNRKLFSKIFIFTITALVYCGAIFLCYFKLKQLAFERLVEKATDAARLSFYFFALQLFCLATFLERCFKFTRRFEVYKNNFETRSSSLTYRIHTSILLYAFTQVFSGYLDSFNPNREWVGGTISFCLFYFMGRSVLKLASFALHSRFTKGTRNGICGKLLKLLGSIFSKFNVITGVNDAIPLLYIACAFFAMDLHFIFLPVILLMLFVMVIFDKFQIMKLENIFNRTPTFQILKVFKVFSWIPLLALAGSFFVVLIYGGEERILYVFLGQEKIFDGVAYYSVDAFGISMKVPKILLSNDSKNLLMITSAIYFLFVLCFCVYQPAPMKSQVLKKFIKNNKNSTYDSVCHQFPFVFEKESHWEKRKEIWLAD